MIITKLDPLFYIYSIVLNNLLNDVCLNPQIMGILFRIFWVISMTWGLHQYALVYLSDE